MVSTTVDPAAPPPTDEPEPRCDTDLGGLVFPLGDVTTVHLSLHVTDAGVVGMTDRGTEVTNDDLVVGDRCGPVGEKVILRSRVPSWTVASSDGPILTPEMGVDVAHLIGQAAAPPNEFFNCVSVDATDRAFTILARIVADASLTCRWSVSIHAA